MAVDLVDDVALKDEAATQVSPRHRTQGLSPARKVWRYVAMPLFLTIVLVGFYLYISGQELDTIEARQLTRPIIQGRLTEHIYVSAISTFFVVLLAVPLGILATRPSLQRFTPGIIGLGNFGQAIPSLGMLTIINLFALTVTWLPSTGTVPAVLALVAYSTLPILRNTMVGLRQVDPNLLEAGRGMGLSNFQVLRKIEMPLAVPVVLAGVRTALVISIGTAALVFLYGAGGLGTLIFQGFQLRREPILLTGAVLTATLALLVDYLAGLVEEWLTPRGI